MKQMRQNLQCHEHHQERLWNICFFTCKFSQVQYSKILVHRYIYNIYGILFSMQVNCVHMDKERTSTINMVVRFWFWFVWFCPWALQYITKLWYNFLKNVILHFKRYGCMFKHFIKFWFVALARGMESLLQTKQFSDKILEATDRFCRNGAFKKKLYYEGVLVWELYHKC